MNSQQRPVALRLAKWHQAMANEPNRNGAKKEKHAITADLLRELLAEPVQEPVAWMSVYPGLPLFVTHAAHEHPQSIVVRESYTIPLYAAPQQPMRCPEDGGACGAGGYCRPEPQQRRPLTDEEALAIIKSTPQEDVTQEGWIRRQRLSWVRAIERAHGITGEQE